MSENFLILHLQLICLEWIYNSSLKTSFFFFWLHCATCRILLPNWGFTLCPLQWKCGDLTTGPPRNSPKKKILFSPIILKALHSFISSVTIKFCYYCFLFVLGGSISLDISSMSVYSWPHMNN